MTHFSHDCSHIGCRTRKAGLNILGWQHQGEHRIDFFARCGVCRWTIIVGAIFQTPLRNDPQVVSGAIKTFEQSFRISEVFPEPPMVAGVMSLPPGVERAFLDGEANFADGRHRAAAARYRTALERALKQLHPDDKGMLNARIRALSDRNEAPSALIELMDGIKFIGNDATHDEEDPPAEEAEAGRDLTRLLLTYLFELPARVAAAHEARNQRQAAARSCLTAAATT